MLRILLKILTRLLYRVQVRGYDHYRTVVQAPGSQKPVLIIANHTSLLDGLLLALYFEDRLTFAVNTQIAGLWWVRFFLSYVDFVTIDTSRPFALRGLVKLLKQGKRVVIFPEGRITLTGTLMKVYPGTALLADHAGAQILPVSIDGAQYSLLSRMGSIQRRWFPRVRISVSAPYELELGTSLRGRARRDVATRQLARLMEQLIYRGRYQWPDLASALMASRQLAGGKALALDDIDRQPLTYNQLVEQAMLLANHMRSHIDDKQPAALLLPTTSAAVITVVAAVFAGRPILLLDTAWEADHILSVCKLAGVQVVYSARRYLATRMPQSGLMEFVHLEDVRDQVRFHQRVLVRVLRLFYAIGFHSRHREDDNAIACLLPIVSSAGETEIVAYSHAGLLAKCRQVVTRLDVGPQDVVLNAWPLSNPYGLVAGLFLPLLNGASIACYLSPYHYRIVPEMAYEMGATILLADSQTLNGYRRYAHPYDFYATRFAFVTGPVPDGAQATDWLERYGVRLFGSLGDVLAGSVLALNTPLFHRAGSAGRLLPGLEFRLEDQTGNGFGRLHIKGDGLMAGTWKHGQLQPQQQEWLATGLSVRIDEDGYCWVGEKLKSG